MYPIYVIDIEQSIALSKCTWLMMLSNYTEMDSADLKCKEWELNMEALEDPQFYLQ